MLRLTKQNGDYRMLNETRTYTGFIVNDDHYMDINKKSGKVEINLHEVMALRLSGMPYTSSDSTVAKTVAIELGLAYNNMQVIRKSTEWGVAREDFKSINTLEDSQVSLLSGFTSQNGNSETSKPLAMTKGDAQSLGMKISGELGDVLRNLIIDAGSKEQFLTYGIQGFVESIAREQRCLDSQQVDKQERQEQEQRDARGAELQNTAVATLNTLGIAEPSKEQILNMVSALLKAESTQEDDS